MIPTPSSFSDRCCRAALATWEASGRLGDLAERFAPGLVAFVLCRHRYIDDCLRHALTGAVEQVVILGAGYDMRAYRLTRELGDRPVFEVDHPATSRRKARVLASQRRHLPDADVRVVEVDFEKDSLPERLRAAGFQCGVRTFFVWEGVAMYLRRDAVKKTLHELREISAAGSEIAMDLWQLPEGSDPISAAQRLSSSALYLVGEPITFAIHPEDAAPFLERLGYRVVEIAGAPTLESRYVHDGRRVYGPVYLVHASTRRIRSARKPGGATETGSV
jgi:methyltransferase (TIGR00027 family)